MRCPGQDMRFWKPGDIFQTECPKCGANVEFFKDEVKRRCRCGHEMINSKIDLGCAQWCPYAEQCVGGVPDEVKAKLKAEDKKLLRERIALEMKKYFGTDFRRMNHALKVARYAEQILKIEGGNPLVVLGAAYLHDIGIHEAERKHGNTSGHFQEVEGPPLARDILERLALEKETIEEICDIVGHHHSPRDREGLHFQIVFEADWLVNIEEEGHFRDRQKVGEIVHRCFKTMTGKQMAEKLYLNQATSEST